MIDQLKKADIRVSLFVDADERELQAAAKLSADIVELHTGRYCDSPAGEGRQHEANRIAHGAHFAHALGLEVHAGHGLSFETVSDIASMPEIVELNIGHFLIGASVFTGFEDAINQMQILMYEARKHA
jgi:pyridoxine 5-phosphate synthase